MDIHRCRFVPYQPSAINAVAFSYPKTQRSVHASLCRLAVGRANGDIEIWNPAKGKWHQELVIRGGKDRSVDGLVWVTEPDQKIGDRTLIGKSRLFSIGYTSTVTEWDLEKGKPKRHASGQHGDIWCLAAQPDGDSSSSNKLVAGTIDGELAIYSVEDGDLRFQRILVKSPTKKTQMVSITFQSKKVVVVGCSDGTIRAYDTNRGHLLRLMTLGSDLVGGSKDVIVWSVKCLPNGDIVSGDSTGHVCIWNDKTYTQSQKIQSHKQDVLSLATSTDGSAIFSGGMDRRTVLHKQTPGSGNRWNRVWGRRYHDHDVKTMATYEQGNLSVVVTGGPDTNIMLIPLREMIRENHRMLSSLPQQAPIMSAPRSRFIVSWWEREIHLWTFSKSASDLLSTGGDDIDVAKNRKLLKTILIKGDANITSASINENATLLAVSTSLDVKLYQLTHSEPTSPADVQIKSVKLPERLTRLGASRVQLSPDSKWLCAVEEGSRVLMSSIIEETVETPQVVVGSVAKLGRLHRPVPKLVRNGGLGGYDRNITHIAFSPDSKVVATADLAGFIDTWILRTAAEEQTTVEDDASTSSESDSSDEEVDSHAGARHWMRNPNGKMIVKLSSPPAVLSFSDAVPVEGTDTADYELLVVSTSWDVLTLHPLLGKLTSWSRQNPRKHLPAPVLDLLDVAKGALWQGSRVWVFGVSFLLMLDLSQDFGPDANGGELELHGVKRKRMGKNSGAGGKMMKSNLAPHQVQRLNGNDWEDVEMAETGATGDEDEDDSDEDEDVNVAEAEAEASKAVVATNSEDLVAVTASSPKKWWITYKYRPILGIVPLGTRSAEDASGPLEVALVERPLWDVKMPERWFASHEVDR